MPPLPFVLAGANLAGGVLNGLTQLGMNNQSQQWSWQMYQQQRKDSIDFWNMQNAYNSPAAQMQRFRDAGLNPNLIYGQGSPGQATSIPTPNPSTPQFRNPEFGSAMQGAALQYMNTIMDLEMKQAQIDNMKEQNKVIRQEAALKSLGLDRGAFDFQQVQTLAETNADIQRERLRGLTTGIDLSINRDARAAALNSANIQEAYSRMLSQAQLRERNQYEMDRLREVIRGIKLDNRFKNLDYSLWKDSGIGRQDPLWTRWTARHLDDISNFARDFFKPGKGSLYEQMQEQVRNPRFPTLRQLLYGEGPISSWKK